MKSEARHITVGLIGIFMVAFLTLTFLAACNNRLDKDEANRQAKPKKGPAEVSIENGQTVLALDSSTQKRLGLEVVSLPLTVTRRQVTAPALILSTQDLATFRNSYLAAQAQLQKSRIEAGVTRKEYARLKTLSEENHNISDKSLQSAEGVLQTNEADVRAAEQQLALQESIVRQEWGRVVAGWALDGSPELQSIFDQHAVLVQVTIPFTATFGPPKTISLETPGGNRTPTNFVSPLPRIDPRIQGKSFLYLASAHSGAFPGLNLLAHLSVGSQMQGVVVPASAVVWSEGKAWLYQQTAADCFTRRAVATDIRVDGGFFVASGLTAGDKVVTQGAQALLSQEFLIHSGGASDEE